jgi:hypothetical protein
MEKVKKIIAVAAILILDFEHKKTFHSVKTDDIFTFIIKFRR